MLHDGRDIDVTAAERPVHALPDGFCVGEPPVLDLPCMAQVHVLEVRVCDPVGNLTGEVGRIGASDQDVPGVQAQRDRRALEHTLYVGTGLHQRSDVRVQHRSDAVLACPGRHAVEIAQQPLPALVVEVRTRVVARETRVGREDHDVGSRGHEARKQPVQLDHRVDLGLVQDEGREASDRGEVVCSQGRGEGGRVSGQEPVRAELGGGQADLAHLGEHLLSGQLVPPTRDLADPPADGCSGDAGVLVHGVSCA